MRRMFLAGRKQVQSRSIKELGKDRGTYRQAGHCPGGLVNEESACKSGELGLIPGLGRSSGEGNGYPLQYSCLENYMEQRSLADYSSWGCKESDMTERLTLIHYDWCKKRKFEHRGTHRRKMMCKDIGEDGYLQAKERGVELDPSLRAFRRNQCCQNFNFRFRASEL